MTVSRVTAVPSRKPLRFQGDIKDLWRVSLPLIISFLSGSLMLFVDRFCLANYSAAALNGCIVGGSWFWPFEYGTMAVAAIAEVMVGQNNGAGRKSQIAVPVWQMIWFSTATLALFIPMALMVRTGFLAGLNDDAMAATYFQILMFFGFLFPLGTALSAFFLGQGRLILITATSILSNVVNGLLDMLLIFGVPGLFEPMGIAGAAWATVIAQALQCFILLAVFLNKRNRAEYGSGHWYVQGKCLGQCLRLGLPNSAAHIIEIFAWIAYFRIMAMAGTEQMTVAAVANSLLCLFYFLSGGISKGVETIAANMIGAQQTGKLWKLLRSATVLHLAIMAVLAVFFLLWPEPLVALFLPTDGAPESVEAVKGVLLRSCVWIWLYYLFDGILWALAGILTASGDTRFLMIASSATAWFCTVLPTYVFVLGLGYHADMGPLFTAFYSLTTGLLLFARLRQKKIAGECGPFPWETLKSYTKKVSEALSALVPQPLLVEVRSHSPSRHDTGAMRPISCHRARSVSLDYAQSLSIP